MGKKKGKKHAHGRHGPESGDMHFELPPQVAGIAAAAVRQVNTPAFQQLIADSLGAASKAMAAMAAGSGPRGAAPPVPPVPPVPPHAAYRPQFETPPIAVPPEAGEAIERVAAQASQAIESAAGHAARAIETAAAALERWVENASKPKAPEGEGQ